MRRLTETSDATRAQRLVDALLVRGIDAEIRPEGGREIWVHEASRLEEARRHVAAFEAGELPDTDEVAERAKRIRRQRKASEDDAAHRYHDMRARWGGLSVGPGAITLLLIGASVLIGLLGGFGETVDARMWNLTIDDWNATLVLQRVREGQWWRLFTPIFLHFGIFHLAFNMLWLHRLGGQVEHGHGHLAMLALVLVSAAVGNLAQYFVSGPAFGGMSGVVYALFGFVWMSSRNDPKRRYVMPTSTTVLMMIWFVLCTTGAFGPIANLGHAGGLVVGLLAGLPAYVRHLRARATRPTFEGHGWAGTFLGRGARFRRRWFDPYVPVWFFLIAVAVIAVEWKDRRDPFARRCPQALFEQVQACSDRLGPEGSAPFYGALESTFAELEGLADDPEAYLDYCPEALADTHAAAEAYGCRIE